MEYSSYLLPADDQTIVSSLFLRRGVYTECLKAVYLFWNQIVYIQLCRGKIFKQIKSHLGNLIIAVTKITTFVSFYIFLLPFYSFSSVPPIGLVNNIMRLNMHLKIHLNIKTDFPVAFKFWFVQIILCFF